MKIAIDMQSCLTDSRTRGIGRYSMGLVEAIHAQTYGSEHIVACLDATDPERTRELRNSLRTRCPGLQTLSYCYPNSPFTDQFPSLRRLSALLKAEFYLAIEPDVILVTSFFEVGTNYSSALRTAALKGIPSVVVAYDLIPLIFPEKYLPAGHFISTWYREQVEEFRKFDLFLAISEVTKADLIEHLGIPAHRIRVIGAGLDATFSDSVNVFDEEDLAEIGITSPFVLTVGNGDWRKNCVGSLHAFAALPKTVRDKHQLVLTQVGDDVEKLLSGDYAWLRDRVIIAGKVSEAALAKLYSECKVFFFPSLYEGFGLPVLEAMAFGAPVLSSSLGAPPEVVHDPRVLFDPRDADASAAILKRSLMDEDFRRVLAQGAREHAMQFTWEKCSTAALSAIAELVGDGSALPEGNWLPTDDEISQMSDAVCETGELGMVSLRKGLEAIAGRGRRRILIDVSEVARSDARSGIQRVVRNYCAELVALARESDSDFRVEPIQWTEQGIVYARKFCRERLDVYIEGEDAPVVPEADDLVYMVDSSWWAPDRFRTLHDEVSRAGGEVVWMVYDLVPILTPELCDPAMPAVFRAWLDYAVRHSDGFICISEATRLDLEEFITASLVNGRYRPWSRSLHLGSDLESGVIGAATDVSSLVMTAIRGRPYCIAVGTIEPRKDYVTILAAFDRLWSEGRDECLVLVGKAGWNVEALVTRIRSHVELGRRLFWLDHASDADLSQLLRGSAALIQASVLEGFGLPVVEAGSQGIPLVLSDIAVFREIAGDEARFFEQGSPQALAEQLRAGFSGNGWISPVRIRTMSWRESSRALSKLLLGAIHS